MKKLLIDLIVTSFEQLNDKYFLLKLFSNTPIPEIVPGQFLEVRVDTVSYTHLRAHET